MEDLLKEIIYQNNALIGLSNTKIAALQEIVDLLKEIKEAQMVNDCSSDTSSILHELMNISDKLDGDSSS